MAKEEREDLERSDWNMEFCVGDENGTDWATLDLENAVEFDQ